MPQYLLSIYQRDGGMPDAEAVARITTGLHRLNEELRESSSWVFTGGPGLLRSRRGRHLAFYPATDHITT